MEPGGAGARCYYDCFCNRFFVGEHRFAAPSQRVFPKKGADSQTGTVPEVSFGEALKLACFGCCCYGPLLDAYNKCTRESYTLEETTVMRSTAAATQISGALVDQREKAVPWSFHEPEASQADFPREFVSERLNGMLHGCLNLMILAAVTAMPCNWGNCHPGCCYYMCCAISAMQLLFAVALNCCGTVCAPCDRACCGPCAWVVRRFFNCRQSCYHSCRKSTGMCPADADPYYFAAGGGSGAHLAAAAPGQPAGLPGLLQRARRRGLRRGPAEVGVPGRGREPEGLRRAAGRRPPRWLLLTAVVRPLLPHTQMNESHPPPPSPQRISPSMNATVARARKRRCTGPAQK